MPGRDNGFVARHYVPLADLDPRLADAMLDALGAESIAAYIEPSTGRLGGYLEVHLPERPRDRLWVDRERHDRAIALLSEHTAGADGGRAAPPEPAATPDPAGPAGPAGPAAGKPDESAGPPSFDEAWAELVANYDIVSDDAVPRWPASEDVLGGGWPGAAEPGGAADFRPAAPHPGEGSSIPPHGGIDEEPSTPVRRRIVRPADTGDQPRLDYVAPERRAPSPSDHQTTPDYGGEYDPLSILDEHFVPPSPPPPPALKPATKWAITAIVVGFALIAAKTFTDTVPGGLTLGIFGIVGGFAVLVAGMRPDRSDDGDSDDGAVV